jgi:hypothetical protein
MTSLFTKPIPGLDSPVVERDKDPMNRTSIVIAFLSAATAFAVAAVVVPAGVLTPPADAFPIFALLLLLESIAFGIGVAYVVHARMTLFGPHTPALRRAIAFAIAYLVLAPWPHDSMHRLSLANGVANMNWFFLAGIEFIFHLGIVPIGLLVAVYALRGDRAAVA